MNGAWCWVSAGGTGGGNGAIACVDIAGAVERALASLGIKPVRPGEVRLRSVPIGGDAHDDAVVARWTADRATVMLHGGRAVVDGFLEACVRAGVRLETGGDDVFIEADGEVESLALAVLARAQSPLAIDLLLDQPRRWRKNPVPAAGGDARDAALWRLIDPALVVAVGPPNIGKSSLLNALAGRSVAVVADQPGTTRDHVGALIDLGGVVVRWVDTPGLEEKAKNKKRKTKMEADEQIQAEAQGLAREVAARADVMVVCCDSRPGGSLAAAPATTGSIVRVGLRADLGEAGGVDASVSVTRGTGLEQLVKAVREAVVPRRFLEDGKPWVFWTPGGGMNTPAS